MMKNISIREDFHCHTNFSHAENSAEEMVRTAILLGLKTIAITEHVRTDTPWFNEYFDKIGRLKAKFSREIKVLCGIEAKAINQSGDLDALDVWCEKVDLTLGSIHSIPRANGGYYEPTEISFEPIRQAWQQTLSGLFANPKVKIIAHPFYELDKYGLSIDQDAEELLFSLAARSDKIIEINLKHKLLNQNLIERLSFAGVKMVIGSDAHSVYELRQLHELKNNLYV